MSLYDVDSYQEFRQYLQQCEVMLLISGFIAIFLLCRRFNVKRTKRQFTTKIIVKSIYESRTSNTPRCNSTSGYQHYKFDLLYKAISTVHLSIKGISLVGVI
jgi:hypothetical protein